MKGGVKMRIDAGKNAGVISATQQDCINKEVFIFDVQKRKGCASA